MKIYESGENYLETILILQNRLGSVRSVDIAEEMNFTKPSVSRAMGILKDNDYISVDKKGHIILTEKGTLTAERIYERHQLLTEYLIHLGVSKKIASEDACRIEHVISDESFEQIKKHANMKRAQKKS